MTAWNQRFTAAARARDLEVLILDEPSARAGALRDSGALAEVADLALVAPGDVAAAADRAHRWAGEFDLRGVCNMREEFVESAAVIADLLGLPSPGLRAARVCRNKFLQRRYLADWSPPSQLLVPGRREQVVRRWNSFPAVLKPVGRLASSGVRLVADRAALERCLGEYSPDEVLLLEHRVEGPEYSVESLSHAGAVCYREATEKRTTEVFSDFFVETGHTTPAPSLDEPARRRLFEVHEAILRRLAVGTGMAHAEYRIGPDGAPVLIEIAVRPPGDSIMALHWLSTSSPLEDAVVALAVGERPRPPAARRFARQVYLPHEPGVLEQFAVDPDLGVPARWFDPAAVQAQVESCGTAGDPPAVRCAFALKPLGQRLGPLRQSSDRAAMFVVDADTAEQLDAIEQRCRAGVRLRTGE